MTRRRTLWLLGVAALALGTWLASDLWRAAPGQSFSGPAPALSEPQLSLAERLRRDVTHLSREIGQRTTYRPDNLTRTADWLAQRLADLGLDVERLAVPQAGWTAEVLAGRLRGSERPDELVVVGAHYDTLVGSPGANGNGSGVAVCLALAEALAASRPAATLVFACFPLSVRPALQTDAMGALAYARHLADQGVEVSAMLSLDSLGYYTDEPDSQHLPGAVAPFFPTVGNYVAIVGDFSSAGLARRVTGLFREHATLPSELGVGHATWDAVGWSDHWAFWQLGWPAVVVTDTGPYRDPLAGLPGDLPERLDYDKLARLTVALAATLEALADE